MRGLGDLFTHSISIILDNRFGDRGIGVDPVLFISAVSQQHSAQCFAIDT